MSFGFGSQKRDRLDLSNMQYHPKELKGLDSATGNLGRYFLPFKLLKLHLSVKLNY